MAIKWSDDLSVGVKEIDLQHQEFIRLLNHLYDFIYSSKPRKELGGILGNLKAYAENHFKTEEKYFDEFHYELAEEHKDEHRKLMGQVDDFQEKFIAGEKEITGDLTDFLEKNWLVDHLDLQDKKYTKCFNEHGLI